MLLSLILVSFWFAEIALEYPDPVFGKLVSLARSLAREEEEEATRNLQERNAARIKERITLCMM